MSDNCCSTERQDLVELAREHRNVLVAVLAINCIMFFVEGIAGLLARSTALQADSLDMLADTFVYGISLWGLNKGAQFDRKISMIKGFIMLALGVGLVLQIVRRFLAPELPAFEAMGLIGGLALAANLSCAFLLLKHRNDSLNMKSTWLCTRNDVLANLGVLIASGLVAWTQSKWPDLVVGTVIGVIIIRSSAMIIQDARTTE